MPDTVGPSCSMPAPAEPPQPAAVEALRLATAYQASRALHVAIRMHLPDLLADSPRSVEDLARETGAHAPSLRRLLRALASYGVFSEAADGRFALGPLGAALRAGAPGSVRDLALMWGDEDYWITWAELERCVCTGRTAAEHLFGAEDAFRRYAADARFGAVFNAGMTVLSAATAVAVVAAYDFPAAGLVVDVGGGQGRLIAAVLRARPGLQGVLLDLPSVVAGAPGLLAEAGVAERCEVVGGDMFTGVPEGGDLYVLSRVIDSFDDARAIAVLANCRRAMVGGHGRLLLVEPVLPDRVGAVAAPDVQENMLMDLNMLVRTGGRERTEAEYRAFLAAAGLRLERVLPTGAPVSLVEAAPT
ncbi:O-methyltransferase family 2 [Methylobacterium nodulans]|uniref:O-methyltransferase family 2 n=1 Tax=Methylobacterium nodulans (strain LMG 21967 / CNCM I-2342 / ORS 2060) TaxID=460265 RepID=B8IQS7_METNO|nr:O-methyltransferase family 2 [Methylobacterium nodulans]ACL62372.1 O-methyltransferase family 2 [Methylobacterium nodulans ORS 2060]